MEIKPLPKNIGRIVLFAVIFPFLLIASPIILPVIFIVLAHSKYVETLPRNWERWYAWRPIRINYWFDDPNYNKILWLEHVDRRYEDSYMEYRTIQE